MHQNAVVVLDNGGGLIKAGFGGERDPSAIIPNCAYRPLSSKKWINPSPTEPMDLTSAAVRRPIDRGYLINPDLQREIWANLFSSILRVNPAQSSLLLTEPLFTLPSIQRSVDELVFEDFNFSALYVARSPSLAHLYEASRRPIKAQCSLVVDCGFSFTHAVPVFQNFPINYAAKRINLGGKALTNYLKELVSYRSVNVMEETFLIDDVKEKLCFVSMNVPRDLQIAKKRGKENAFRCTYVLPDGVTHTQGLIKNPDVAKRYLAIGDGDSLQEVAEKMDVDRIEVADKLEGRNKIDMSKNEFDLANERFLVPEMIFHPADLGMNQAGLAECIVRAVSSCHPHLHPVLYESIILTGGSILFPQLADRLEREPWPPVPDDYQVKITPQEDPMRGVWRGGSVLSSSPDFEAMCVTKAEHEEFGSARCRKRFF